jgi:hypothetical protein
VRIGSLHINWLTPAGKRTIAVEVVDAIATHPAPSAVIAKMARSEVKNYLAQLAEEAEMPFGNPAGFLRTVRIEVFKLVTTGHGTDDPDEPYDAPFNVIDKANIYPCATPGCQGLVDEDHRRHTHPQPDDDRRDFCNATPKDCTWPVCNRLEHDDDWHECSCACHGQGMLA